MPKLPKNQIDVVLTDAQIQAAMTARDAAKTALPLVDLSPEARQSLPRVKENALPFILKALEIARQNPDILRRDLDVDAMQHDLQSAQKLLPVLLAFRQLLDEMEDTFALLLIEAYGAGLSIYGSVKDTAELNEAESELAEYFKRKKKENSSPA